MSCLTLEKLPVEFFFKKNVFDFCLNKNWVYSRPYNVQLTAVAEYSRPYNVQFVAVDLVLCVGLLDLVDLVMVLDQHPGRHV